MRLDSDGGEGSADDVLGWLAELGSECGVERGSGAGAVRQAESNSGASQHDDFERQRKRRGSDELIRG